MRDLLHKVVDHKKDQNGHFIIINVKCYEGNGNFKRSSNAMIASSEARFKKGTDNINDQTFTNTLTLISFLTHFLQHNTGHFIFYTKLLTIQIASIRSNFTYMGKDKQHDYLY